MPAYLRFAHQSALRTAAEEHCEGGLAIDRRALAELERFDGKFVVTRNDDSLAAEDTAQGYKQPQRVEKAWRNILDDLNARSGWPNC